MPFEILRNDITRMNVDVIVNTANPRPVIGSGLDTQIHEAAGPGLLKARKLIGSIPRGESRITDGYDLPARYVIHSVGPVWRGGIFGEEKVLRRCYESALRLARDHGCSSVALPLISTGNYRFPKEKALRIATDTIRDFLSCHEMQIYLVVYDAESVGVSQKLFRDITSFIDDRYVEQVCGATAPGSVCEPIRKKTPLPVRAEEDEEEEVNWEAFLGPDFAEDDADDDFPRPKCSAPSRRRFPRRVIHDGAPAPRRSVASAPTAIPPKAPTSIDDFLSRLDAGFSETLLTLIDQTGRKDSEIYTRANVSRQLFSKIRNTPDYKPTKTTAIAFAIALELNLEQTRDLIGRAGYALTNSSKFDLIIMYFIANGNYDLYEINAMLFRFDQSLLGV